VRRVIGSHSTEGATPHRSSRTTGEESYRVTADQKPPYSERQQKKPLVRESYRVAMLRFRRHLHRRVLSSRNQW
jgi:hypothetical protein